MLIEGVYFFFAFFFFLLSALILILGRSFKNLTIASTIALLGYGSLYYGLYFSGMLESYPRLFMTYQISSLMGPIALYLYIKSTVNDPYIWRAKDVLHLIIPLAQTIRLLPYLGMGSEEKTSLYLLHYDNRLPEEWPAAHDAIVLKLVMAFYLVLIFRTVCGKFRFSEIWKNTGNRRQHGYFYFILFLLLVPFALLFLFWAADIPSRTVYKIAPILINMIIPAIIVWLALFPYTIRLGYFVNGTEELEKIFTNRSRLDNLDLDEISGKLTELMISEKLYRKERLTIRMLASRMDIHPHQLSEYLNRVRGISFWEYINGLRIEEAIRMLENEEEFNATRIAFECGFNSVSTFYDVFKKKTGRTPFQYRRDLNPG